jgi:hypothetical protein
VKQTFLDLNVKLSDKVTQLEDRLVEAENRIDILSSKNNYRKDEVGIKYVFTKKSIETDIVSFVDRKDT